MVKKVIRHWSLIVRYWLLIYQNICDRLNYLQVGISPFVRQNLTVSLLKGIGIGMLLFLSSCSIIDPEEQIPAYLEINSFELTTTPAQGENSAQITEAWVFVNDLSLGIYELPATVPVLELGSQNITIFPVIRENGRPSTPIIYPLYRRYETTLELMANQTINIQPTTTYQSNTVSYTHLTLPTICSV